MFSPRAAANSFAKSVSNSSRTRLKASASWRLGAWIIIASTTCKNSKNLSSVIFIVIQGRRIMPPLVVMFANASGRYLSHPRRDPPKTNYLSGQIIGTVHCQETLRGPCRPVIQPEDSSAGCIMSASFAGRNPARSGMCRKICCRVISATRPGGTCTI